MVNFEKFAIAGFYLYSVGTLFNSKVIGSTFDVRSDFLEFFTFLTFFQGPKLPKLGSSAPRRRGAGPR